MTFKEQLEIIKRANPHGNVFWTRHQLIDAIRENHEHHLAYDDTGTYPASDLCNTNTDALGLPRMEPTGA